jgi:hypothetical protein
LQWQERDFDFAAMSHKSHRVVEGAAPIGKKNKIGIGDTDLRPLY